MREDEHRHISEKETKSGINAKSSKLLFQNAALIVKLIMSKKVDGINS